LLLKALEELGFDSSKVEVNETAQPLIDFRGRPTHYVTPLPIGDRAEIIIRRKHVGGAANDIGFRKTANGTYEAIISEYDSSRYSSAWLGKLTAAYARHGLISKMEKQGFKYAGNSVKNGTKTQMQFVRS
jgi:hypothetical protein